MKGLKLNLVYNDIHLCVFDLLISFEKSLEAEPICGDILDLVA
jgi:hypothetical protein